MTCILGSYYYYGNRVSVVVSSRGLTIHRDDDEFGLTGSVEIVDCKTVEEAFALLDERKQKKLPPFDEP